MSFTAQQIFLPGAYYAVAQGWLRPCGAQLFDPIFCLTATGATQAA